MKAGRELRLAVVGATGAVGQTMIQVLEEREFPVASLELVASQRSAGRRLPFRGRQLEVRELESFEFGAMDLALFSAGSAVSARHAPRAAAAGCVVIDNTSCFRYEEDIPLVVPEVNPDALENHRRRNIIANPNCSTIQMVMVMASLELVFPQMAMPGRK